jgi:uncharacterized membrane protein
MKTELIFFDKFENSIKGTQRGLIAYISLIVLDYIWFSLMKSKYYYNKKPINIFSVLIVYTIICSALGVQLPKNYGEALVYSLLVGFVVYSVFNLTNYSILNEWKLDIVIYDILWGMFNCAVAGSLIYLIYWKNKI